MSSRLTAHLTSDSAYALGQLVALSLEVGRPLRASSDDDRELYLEAGEVLHARCRSIEGAAAVYALLDDTTLRFRVELDRAAPRRSVTTSWRRLCHEARCALADG
jgi:hypothetical protein